jgi:hypothetical protein
VITLPDPALDEAGKLFVDGHDIVAALHHGPLGGCVICRSSSATWWSLTECGMTPVTDSRGHLTEWVPLHRWCAPEVLGAWAILLHGDPGEDGPEPLAGDAFEPAAPPPTTPGPRRSPTGAWARRTGGS